MTQPSETELLRADQQELLDAVKDRWPGAPISELDRIARLLIATWEKFEHTTVNAATVATFVDMARVVVDDTAAQVHDARLITGLTFCIHDGTVGP